MKGIVFQRTAKVLLIFVLLLAATHPVIFAQQGPLATQHAYFRVETQVLDDGTSIDMVVINGPPTPPPGYARTTVDRTQLDPDTTVTLSVPAYNWSFGCTATSAAMIAAYYDRTGYPDMYTGPTNGGVMPMDNSVWPDWVDSNGDTRHQCPLSATHNGLDGRATNGHVDDYWWWYGNASPDPFIGHWAEHAYGDCTGDYMKTNQSTYGNSDGSTTLYFFTDGTPLYWYQMEGYGIAASDGGYGLKLFYESRGYTVADMYNQRIRGQGSNPTLGFTYDQYKAEIDAGRPVMIHVTGHTMVGVGYDDSTSNLMYINDTWDYGTHTMTWGGTYAGLQHYGVTIVQLAVPTAVDLVSFTAEPAPDGSTIALDWETASEIDNVGFNLYRAGSLHGPRTQLNPSLILSQAPGSPAGAVYTWPDESVIAGIAYYYWLEDVDVHGVATLHGPVTAELAPAFRLLPARPRPLPDPPIVLDR
jgi:hypothetical protein